ncbi:PstS family phosphate ABC transporter substrate-binding protein [Flavihumibacter fluvii]|uniref:PstS family phosphate ABC transporter substrate-binding protein n=1 Tax=Flavihumibacter fluvii TaxID=2838157 RepID=UPI001BDEE8AA|nr:substrate-binding domain-containing protein [Flavihumibacter fluvii]ULQ50793.1 substrate-binding domain-containing protein [Flavihumibacter fluvii]
MRLIRAFMLKRKNRLTIAAATMMLFSHCNNGPVVYHTDKLDRGTIHISVDESFKPVIDSQIKVFESSFPDAHIVAHYKPEADCLKDMLVDSIRMVIITRQLQPSEEQRLKDTLSFIPVQGRIAYDAVTVIVNKQSKDSVLEIADVKSLLNGTSTLKLRPVLDGLTATSTVRYALDSILQGQPLGKTVTAATSSQGVIDYVAANPDAVGFVGVSWIGNPEDSAHVRYQRQVTIASLHCKNCVGTDFVKPSQANIATLQYPLVRGLHYILKENYEGLGSGFANFLIYERGQLIFRRAYLWPARMQFEIRSAGINE